MRTIRAEHEPFAGTHGVAVFWRPRWGALFAVTALGAALSACGGATTSTSTSALGAASTGTPPRMRPGKPNGHLARVTCLSFSPDGRRLVSGSEDQMLLVWDVETGEVVQRLEGHQGFVNGCVFLPGDRVVSGGARGEVFVWDAKTGKAIRELSGLPPAHDVYALSARADGREVIAGTFFGRVIAWNLETGETTFGPNDDIRTSSGRTSVRAVGFLPGDRRFGSAAFGKTIVWGETPVEIDVHAASGAVLPGGRLALGTSGKVVVAEGERVTATLSDETGTVTGLAASPTGSRLFAGDNKGRGRVWGIASRKVQCTLDSPGACYAAAWSPNEDRVATGGEDGLVRLGDLGRCSGGGPLLGVRTLGEARGRVYSVARDATSVFLGDSTGRISTWRTADWHVLKSAEVHQREVLSMVVLPDGRLVSGGNDRAVMLSDHGAVTPLASLRNPVFALSALPDGSHVFAGDGSGDVTKIPFEGPATRLWTAPEAVHSIALTPEGALLAGGGWNTIVRFPLAIGQERAEWPEGFSKKEDSTTALLVLPDGRFVQGNTGGDVLLRRGETVEMRFQGLSKQVSALAVTGPFLWAGGVDQKLVRWKLDGPATADMVLPESATVLGLTATPGGFLVAGLGDGSASVRDLSNGTLVAQLYPFRDGSGATLFPDGSSFFTPGEARSLRFEDSISRKAFALGAALSPSISPPRVSLLPDRSAAIHTTVFSPSGPPKVTLDDGRTIESITPSPTALSAYEVDLRIATLSSGTHTFTLQPPEGAPVRATFEMLPDPRVSPKKTRALLITNSAYERRPKVPGASKDVALIKGFLESEDGWHLPADRIDVQSDLRGGPTPGGKPGDSGSGAPPPGAPSNASTFSGVLTDFFARAEPDETLFFYFSGHGETDVSTSYLLPIDAAEKKTEYGLSRDALWKAIRASKAARIVVVLDAVRAGRFVVPSDLVLQSNAVVFAATDPDWAGPDLSSEAPFTRAFVDAMHSPEAVDIDAQAVTLRGVFRAVVADPRAWARTPVLIGMGEMLQFPLAWPPNLLKRPPRQD